MSNEVHRKTDTVFPQFPGNSTAIAEFDYSIKRP